MSLSGLLGKAVAVTPYANSLCCHGIFLLNLSMAALLGNFVLL